MVVGVGGEGGSGRENSWSFVVVGVEGGDRDIRIWSLCEEKGWVMDGEQAWLISDRCKEEGAP